MRRSAWLLVLLVLGGELSAQGTLTPRTPTMSWMRWWERMRKKLAYWLKTRRGVFKHKNTFGFVTMQKVLPSLTHLLATVAAGMQVRNDRASWTRRASPPRTRTSSPRRWSLRAASPATGCSCRS